MQSSHVQRPGGVTGCGGAKPPHRLAPCAVGPSKLPFWGPERRAKAVSGGSAALQSILADARLYCAVDQGPKLRSCKATLLVQRTHSCKDQVPALLQRRPASDLLNSVAGRRAADTCACSCENFVPSAGLAEAAPGQLSKSDGAFCSGRPHLCKQSCGQATLPCTGEGRLTLRTVPATASLCVL